MHIKKIIIASIFAAFIFEQPATGLSAENKKSIDNKINLLPYKTRLFSTGNASDLSMLEGDLMLPVFGNTEEFFYINPNLKIGQQRSWLGSLGSGFRRIFTDKILGAYLFYDRNSTVNQGLFSVFNPGIEGITNRWDLHVNGYFPKKSEQSNGFFFANQVGISSFVVFNGHNAFDHILECFEAVGNGFDMEVGKTWLNFSNVRTYLGGYYYSVKTLNAIKGIQSGVEYPLNQNLRLGFNYSYDNVQKNVVSLSLRLSFGYPARSHIPNIHERMLDPVIRHLGTLNTGSGIPSKKGFRDVTPTIAQLENDKIWFFSPTGSSFNPLAGFNNCTYENPCNVPSFNQNNVNNINSLQANAVLYFAPATYTITNVLSPANRVTLNDGQSMFGRTSDFLLPAPTANRPLFVGGFDLTGNNILSDLNLSGLGTTEIVGIQSFNADNLSLTNLSVSNYVGLDGVNPGDAGGDAFGILMSNGQNIQMLNVTVSNIMGGRGANALNGSAGVDASADGGGTVVAIAGTGGQGTDAFAAGAGGNAAGIVLTNVAIDFNQVFVNMITGGIGGTGGQGGSGGNANATNGLTNNATGAAGVGGTGGDGGNGSRGGLGGSATGIQLNGASGGDMQASLIENITGGVGGNGGSGGRGGDANANSNDNQNVAGVGGLAGGAVMFNGVPTGGGGIGGSSGDGGNGGDAIGLRLLAGSNLQISNTSIMFLNAGQGGTGAVAANGGDAVANGNLAGGGDGGGSVYSGGTGGQGGGNGAIGGAGGNGGATYGFYLSGASSANTNNVTISNLFGGNGGNAGQGGNGGNADANGNLAIGGGGIAGAAVVNGGTGGVGGGLGGFGGRGGDGGIVSGIALNDTSSITSTTSVVSNIMGGSGGIGGAGGSGGTANAQNNSGNGGVGGIAGGGTLAGGTGGQGGGFAGNGGNNGIGADVTAASLNGSSIVLGGLTFSNLQGGNGAGSIILAIGGQGGSALSFGNLVGPNTNGNGGDGGSGGNGGSGGATNGTPSGNPPATSGTAGALGGFGNPNGGTGGAGGDGQLGGFIP